MWFEIVLIVLATALGAVWAWLNYQEIKNVALEDGRHGEDEMQNINLRSALGIVEIGAIIHEGAS